MKKIHGAEIWSPKDYREIAKFNTWEEVSDAVAFVVLMGVIIGFTILV